MASNLSAVLVILHCSFFSSVVVAFCFNAKALFTDYGVSSEDFGKAALISIPFEYFDNARTGLVFYESRPIQVTSRNGESSWLDYSGYYALSALI